MFEIGDEVIVDYGYSNVLEGKVEAITSHFEIELITVKLNDGHVYRAYPYMLTKKAKKRYIIVRSDWQIADNPVVHNSLEAAEKEAMRLGNQYQKNFFVLEIVSETTLKAEIKR